MDKQLRGRHFESLAKQYLLERNLQLVQENYHCRWGEIDLVMRDDTAIVFVEVRYRGPGSKVDALSSVDRRKQKKLCNAGLMYLTP
eukprot:UN15825